MGERRALRVLSGRRPAISRRPGDRGVGPSLLRAGFVLALLALAAAGCSPASVVPTPTSALAPPKPAPGTLTGLLPSSELVVGANNRFLVGLLDDRNKPVTDAQVRLRFFKLNPDGSSQMRSETSAKFRGSPQLGDKGLYVARTGFEEAGPWGVEVEAARPDGTTRTLRLSFAVNAQSRTPALGARPPASQSAVATDPRELEQICSARPVDEFHRLSIARALEQRRPLVILFATPGFCQTLTCGPSLEVVRAATARHGDRLNVVHVEIYKGAQPPEIAPTVTEWNLPSEPWVFLIDADGKVVDKYEGGITIEELDPAVAQLVGS